ncbi:hypothetical protein H6P81_010705 [Aristolochia fimbriata]|uniref:Uncharacterized protein n=1 Tax=Aristolochia fimbriata TaxID=158543 RepID=A0AAV7EPJ4_ARIFI|nr:hypothetical protein H6P81_010705 [Aristolochia fimbriata]
MRQKFSRVESRWVMHGCVPAGCCSSTASERWREYFATGSYFLCRGLLACLLALPPRTAPGLSSDQASSTVHLQISTLATRKEDQPSWVRCHERADPNSHSLGPIDESPQNARKQRGRLDKAAVRPGPENRLDWTVEIGRQGLDNPDAGRKGPTDSTRR